MTSASQRVADKHSRGRTVLSWLFFIFAGAIVALVGLKLTFVVQGRWGHDAFIRWGGLTGFTLGLFALFVSESEKFLRKSRFWVMTAILLAVHLAVFGMILTRVEEWKLMWFMVMVLEYPLFRFFRERFVTLT